MRQSGHLQVLETKRSPFRFYFCFFVWYRIRLTIRGGRVFASHCGHDHRPSVRCDLRTWLRVILVTAHIGSTSEKQIIATMSWSKWARWRFALSSAIILSIDQVQRCAYSCAKWCIVKGKQFIWNAVLIHCAASLLVSDQLRIDRLKL